MNRGRLGLAILKYAATKTSKTGHFGVLRSKSSDTNTGPLADSHEIKGFL